MISNKDFEFKQFLFVVTNEGEKIAIKNDNIVVYDNDGSIKHQSTCFRLFAIFVIGNISITNVLIQKAKKYGFAIIFMTNTFKPYYCISSNGEANVLLRKKQYEYNDVNIAQCILKNKIYNQLQELMSIRKKGVTQLDAIKRINTIYNNIYQTTIKNELMGKEGYAARFYFSAYFDNVEWLGRKPRIKCDLVNSLLDIGYSLLFSFVESIALIYGFDIYVGVLHNQFYMRKSLICDLIEPFRIIIDRCVKKGINLNQFNEKDFIIKNNQWILRYDKNAYYVGVFAKEILKYKTDIFKYVHCYYKSFMKGNFNDNTIWWER